MDFFEKKNWWSYIEEDIRGLLTQAFGLFEFAKSSQKQFDDYAFVVFPAAKGFEGFMKKVFLDMGFISSEDYYGKRFRIGKALNPNLEEAIRHESVYDKLVKYCKGKKVADQLWETWRLSRNLVFHWFPNEKNNLTLDEAKKRLDMIISAMDSLFSECKIS